MTPEEKSVVAALHVEANRLRDIARDDIAKADELRAKAQRTLDEAGGIFNAIAFLLFKEPPA